jgi:hypothetical protein
VVVEDVALVDAVEEETANVGEKEKWMILEALTEESATDEAVDEETTVVVAVDTTVVAVVTVTVDIIDIV